MENEILINKAASIERCIAQSVRDVFTLLAQANLIDNTRAETMKRIIGFHNIAAHDYQALLLPIVENIIKNHLDDFINFSKQLFNINNKKTK